MKQFGKVLEELMIGRGIGVRHLAGAVGCSPSYISELKNGKRLPPRDKILKEIARVLNVDQNQFLRFANDTRLKYTNMRKAAAGYRPTSTILTRTKPEVTKMDDDYIKNLEEALKMCIDALYEAVNIAPLDRLPQKAGSAIQQAQAVLGI